MIDFTFKIVDTPELLEEIYRLRYHVYVRECHFLREEDYPDGRETDKFDAHSVHFAAIDDEGELAGSVRLVFDSPLGLPFEDHCKRKLGAEAAEVDRPKLAEISRLVISKSYRRRKNDGLYYEPGSEDLKMSASQFMRRLRPMAFGMYRLVYQESKRRGITHWLAAMEDSLFRLLGTHGFVFRSIGEPIEYYGAVIPYLGEISKMEKLVQVYRPDYYQYFIEGLEPQFLPASDIF